MVSNMNKKGLTLVELLAVIALIAAITLLAVSSIKGVNKAIKKNILKRKVTLIEEAAELKGHDLLVAVKNSPLLYNSDGQNVYHCMSFSVSELVSSGYLEKDNDNNCLVSSTSSNEKGCIENPVDDNKSLDLEDVIVYYKNKKIITKLDLDNEEGHSFSNCFLYGDANDDKVIDSSDALLYYRCSIGLEPWSKCRRMDVNLDGEGTCYDSCVIARYVHELIDYLPYIRTVEECENTTECVPNL